MNYYDSMLQPGIVERYYKGLLSLIKKLEPIA